MLTLTLAQADRLGRAILALNEPATLGTLPERVFETLRGLIGHERCSLGRADPARRGVDGALSHPMPPHLLVPEIAASWYATPVVASGLVFRSPAPTSILDHMPQRDFEAGLLYQRLFEPHGLAHEMTLAFDVEGGAVFLAAVLRGAARFTETERTMFALLRPHLRQRRRALQAAEPDLPIFGRVLPDEDHAWLMCRADGEIVQHSRSAPSAVRLYGLRFGRRIPEAWGAWLGAQLAPVTIERPLRPLPVQAGRRRALLYCLPNRHSGEHRLILLPARGAEGALSDRERDVARWIAAGKTNAEIGDILAISPNTVKNHVARILQKIGAPSRAAIAGHGGSERPEERSPQVP